MLTRCLRYFFPVCAALLLIGRLVIWKFLPVSPVARTLEGDLILSFMLFLFCALFFLYKIFEGKKILYPRPLVWVFGSLILSFISISYSHDQPVSLQASLNLAAAVFFCLTLVNCADTKTIIVRFIYIFILLAAASSILAFIQYCHLLTIDPAELSRQLALENRGQTYLLLSKRPPSFFGWPNMLSGFLILILPLNGLMALKALTKPEQWLWGACALVNCAALYLTLTISSWVSLGLAVAIALVFSRVLKNKKRAFIFIIGSICLVCAAVIVQRVWVTKFISSKPRQSYTSHALTLIREHPLLGHGLNTFNTINTPMAKNKEEISAYTHNSYLQIWVELGGAGLALFLLFMFSLYTETRLTLSKADPAQQWLYGGLLTGILAFLIDNLFSYTILNPFTAVFWWAMIGLALSWAEKTAHRGYFPAPWIIKILLLAACGCGYLTFRLALAEHEYFRAMYVLNNGNEEAALGILNHARNFNPWDKKTHYSKGLAYWRLFQKTRDPALLDLAKKETLEAAKQNTLKKETGYLLEEISGLK